MPYCKAKEEKEWKCWKEKEEKKLRELGMNENLIQKLRQMDWEDFNEERRYREHYAPYPEYQHTQKGGMETTEIDGIQTLLDNIDNDRLLHILLDAEQRTLQILILKMKGFSVQEIAQKTQMSKRSIYCRIDRLKRKIKNIL